MMEISENVEETIESIDADEKAKGIEETNWKARCSASSASEIIGPSGENRGAIS